MTPTGRFLEAKRMKSAAMRLQARATGLPFPVPLVYFRAFKEDRVLQVWGAMGVSSKFRLLKSYRIAAAAGTVGPKRKQGDHQVPEGFYTIDRFHPGSSYLLALGVSYPNQSDRILGAGDALGGDIFLHGDAVSDGCLAMTDDQIMEIYLWAWNARQAGQSAIRIDIFPFKMSGPRHREAVQHFPENAGLWRALKRADQVFEQTRTVPKFKVKSNGQYEVLSR